MKIYFYFYFYFFLLLFTSLTSSAQDLSGIWRGSFNQVIYHRDAEGNKVAIPIDRYKFEVQIDQGPNTFQGVTYSYLTTVFYGKATARGTINKATKKVLLEELKIVELRMASGNDACIQTFFLQYSKSGNEEFLEGTYTGINTRDSSRCGEGKVFLRKVETSDFYKEPFLVRREKEKEKELKNQETKITPRTTPPLAKTDNTKKPVNTKPKTTTSKAIVKSTPPDNQPPAKVKTARVDSLKKNEKSTAVVASPRVLTSRMNELVRTITTSSKEITVNLYDNGTIDNDTVSVYLNKKLIVSKQRLTEKPITFKITLDEDNDYHELVMVAENLGEIPPNTSLMVVKAGGNHYEVRITSNEQKNAVVAFKYEKG